LVTLPDLAAMKQRHRHRGAKVHFYDIAESLEHLTLPQMIGFFVEKYPSTDAFTVIRSLAWFEDAEQEPDPISLNGRSWNDVMVLARTAVAGL
jgi:hypothetical protein